MVFLEFCLFSGTCFIEYTHRTYSHFYSMYPILTKIQKDVISGEIPAELVQESEHTEKLLAQASFNLERNWSVAD